MTELCEILLDYPAFRHKQVKLAAPPSDLSGRNVHGPWKAKDWANAYGGMVNYNSALLAAGYAKEADMKTPQAAVLITFAGVMDDGALCISTSYLKVRISAEDIFAAHGMSIPYGAKAPRTDNENESPRP
jgi:hypothetical protein